MTHNTAISAVLQSLATSVAALQPAAITPKIDDQFDSNDPFDLSTRSWSSAYDNISVPLDDVWSGDVDTFPSFVVSLRFRTKEGKWNKAGTQGLLKVATIDNLTDYHSITDTKITDARTGRTDNHTKKNTKAVYACIKSLIKGDVKHTIFA